jgi:hypothetical protein
MKISLQTGTITGSELFRLVCRGWFAGILAIFFPTFLLFGFLIVLPCYNSELKPLEYVSGLFLLPLIAAGQALMLGVMVVFGVKVWPPQPPLGPSGSSNRLEGDEGSPRASG